MLKRKDGKEINPDTFIYTVPVFRLVHSADEEFIFIRTAVENGLAIFMYIDKNGQYTSYQLRTNKTFRTEWSNSYTAYECTVDNIDVEYH